MMKTLVTPIKIQGKKTKLIDNIFEIAQHQLSDHPEIDTWVEPFLGSGAVVFNCSRHSQIKNVIVNDINPHIINFYKGINDGVITATEIQSSFRDFSDKLKEGGYDFYNEIKDRFNKNFDTMDFLFLTRTGFNGLMRFNNSGKWNVPFCKLNNRLSDRVINDLADSVQELSELFNSKNFEFHNESFENVIMSAPETSIFYCDPPYYGLETQYYKGWGEQNEIQLNKLLQNKVFIYSTWIDDGNKENPMIEKLWGQYEKESISHKYNVAQKASERKNVTEGLIFNGTTFNKLF